MTEPVSTLASADDHDFDGLNRSVREHFADTITQHGSALFTVDAGDLYAAYIDNLPEGQQQHHRCSCCKKFIQRYGSLASIDGEGRLRPVMWGAGTAPGPYTASIDAMAKAVASGPVTGVFLASEKVWGAVATGIMLSPSMWAGEDAHPNQGKFAMIVLDGAKDRRDADLALFPEILRSDLHPIRSTIEAYSRSRKLTGREEGTCSGLIVGRGSDQARIRITSAIGTACYRVDRWD